MRGRIFGVVVCAVLGFGCGRLKPAGSSADAASDASEAPADAYLGADVAEVGDADASREVGTEASVDASSDTLADGGTDASRETGAEASVDGSDDTEAEAGAVGTGGNHMTTDGL